MIKTSPSRWALVTAAGTSKRMGYNKLLQPVDGKTILEYSLHLFVGNPYFEGVVVTLPEQDEEYSFLHLDHSSVIRCAGGNSRSESVMRGLKTIEQHTGQSTQIWVHDAARPCLTRDTIVDAINRIESVDQPAIFAARANDSVKRVTETSTPDKHLYVEQHCDRKDYWLAQTPQIARLDQLIKAYDFALNHNIQATDEATALGLIGLPVQIIPCNSPNPKVTYPADGLLVEQLLLNNCHAE